VFYLAQVVTAVVYDEYSTMGAARAQISHDRFTALCTKAFGCVAENGLLPGSRALELTARLSRTSLASREAFTGVDWSGPLSEAEFAKVMEQAASSSARSAPRDPKQHSSNKWQAALQALLQSAVLVRIFQAASLVNAVLVLSTERISSSAERGVLAASSILPAGFGLLYIVDMFATLVAFGPRGVLRLKSGDLRARISLTVSCVVAISVHICVVGLQAASAAVYHFHALLLVHLVPTLSIVPGFREHLSVMARVAPAMTSLVLANICVMYAWAVAGVLLVGGKFTVSNPALVNYSGGTMFTMNFNTVPNGIYTLFMAIYGNNMQQIVQPLFLVGGWPMLLHFITFYLFSMFVTANVLVSSLIDVHQQVSEERKASRVLGVARGHQPSAIAPA